MEDESMKAVLHKGEEQQTNAGGEDCLSYVQRLPTRNLQKEVSDDDQRHEGDQIPLAMGEVVDPFGFEHLGRGDEEPMGRVDHMHVLLMTEVPYLGEEGLVWVDDAFDVLFK
jgi:hypothetical protein